MKKLITLIWAVTLIASMAYAQLKTADIYGTVTLADGSVIPGVSVTLTGTVGGTQTTVTSEDGNFRFIKLPPATYDLRFELDGFKTVVEKGIRLNVGKNITLSTVMETTAIKEEVMVVAKAGVVDTRKTMVGVNVTKEAIQSLPTARNPWTLISLVPGMMMDRPDVGGSESGQQSNMYGHGTDRFDTTWNIDGANNTDQAALGGAISYLNVNAYEEVQVSIGANDITAQTGGTQINFVTKRGGNKYSGDFHIYAEDKAWELKQNIPDSMKENNFQSPGINRLYQYGINFGGPLVKEHAWFFGSYAVQDIHSRSETGAEDTTWLLSGYAKFNFQLGGLSGMYNLSYNNKKKWNRTTIGAAIQSDSSLLDQSAGKPLSHMATLSYTTGNLMLEGRFLSTNGGFYLKPKGNERAADGIHSTGADMWYYYYPRFYLNGGNLWDDYDRPTSNYSIDGNYFMEKVLGGDHEVRFGAEYFKANSWSNRAFPNQRLLLRRTDNRILSPDLGATVGFHDIFNTFLNKVEDVSNYRTAFYLQDTYTVKRFTINAGVRYDYEYGKVNSVTLPGFKLNGQVVPEWVPYLGDKQISGFDAPGEWKTWSPRISLTYDFSGKGKTVLKVSAAQYGSAGGINIASRASQGLVDFRQIWVPWDDTNGNRLPDVGEFQALTPAQIDAMIVANPDWANYMGYAGFDPTDPKSVTLNSKFDSNFSSPKTDELVVSLEREVMTDLAVSLSGFYRKFHNGAYSRNYWNRNGQVVLEGVDNLEKYATDPMTGRDLYRQKARGFSGAYWTNYKDSYQRFLSLQMLATKKLSNRWFAEFSFNVIDWKYYWDKDEYFQTYSGSAQSLANYSYYNEAVNAPQSNASGLSGVFVNSRWVLKFNGLYQLPGGFNVTAVFTAQDGYVVPQHVTVYRGMMLMDPNAKFGDIRLPNLWMLNLGLEKTFKIDDTTSATVFVDGYNITNNNTTLKVETTLGPKNGLPLKILNAGLFQFGFRLNF